MNQQAQRRLLELDRTSFYAVVDDDLRDKTTPEVAQALRSPAVYPRWLRTLQWMRTNVQHQIEARDAEAKANELDARLRHDDDSADGIWRDHLRRRAASVRFRAGVEEKLYEAALLAIEDPTQTTPQITSKEPKG